MSNFVFDNISSHIFSLIIGSIGNSEVTERSTFSNIEILKDRSAKRIEPYIYGRKFPDNLEFPMEIYNKHGQHYEMFEIQAIQEWLFGRAEAKYLSILDPDKGNESYLCWLTNPQIVKIDNRAIGWKFNVLCTMCYSLTDTNAENYELLTDSSMIEYYNLSNIEDYLYPEMSIRLLGTTTYIRIENANDDNRVFQVTNIKEGNSIYVNNDHCYMTALNGDNIFQNFNLNWFRFAPGYNKLLVTGRCNITFRNRFMKAVGGY